MNTLFFALQTVPDVEVGRVRYSLGELNDKGSAKAMFHHQQQQTGADRLPLYLQRIVSLSAIHVDDEQNVHKYLWSGEDFSEKEILTHFADVIAQAVPSIVTWDSGFDVPVIQYRCLKNSVPAADFLAASEAAEIVDLKSALSAYSAEASASIQDVSTLLGFPVVDLLDDQTVWKLWQSGEYKPLGQAVERDVYNIYQIYLRYLLVRGG